MKIIDMRLRPPFGSFLNPDQQIFQKEFSTAFAADYDAKFPKSAEEKSLDLCLKEMDEAGITKGVVPVRVTQGCSNEDIAELLAMHPDRFIGMAGVFHDDIEKAVNDIEKFVVDGPFTGVFLEPTVCGKLGSYEGTKHADDKRLYPIYETCQSKNISMLISFGGFTAPDHSYNDPIHIDQVARDFPNLKMILGHGSWPYVSQACFVAMNRENVYLSPDLYMINSWGQVDYALAANYRIRDKIIFGTAYPCIEFSMAVEHYLKQLRPEVVEDIMYYNAVRALGLDD